jgi:hypothetical protein
VLAFDDFLFELSVLLFEQFDGIFIVVSHFVLFENGLFEFDVFGVDNFLQFVVLIIESLYLIKMLFLNILDFVMIIKIIFVFKRL